MNGSPNGTPPTVIPLKEAFPGVIEPDRVQRLTATNAPVGARILLRRSESPTEPLTEVTVLEWSSSCKHVKLQYLTGVAEWLSEPVIPFLVERLPDSIGGSGCLP